MTYKNKQILKTKYEKLGSTRRVGRFFGVSNGTIIYWMRKFNLPRIPKLHLGNNKSAKGRLGELCVIGHPYFKNDVIDMGLIDDKYKGDLIWRGDKVNVKTSHSTTKPSFRVKDKKKRHQVRFYICLHFNDKVSFLIPQEIWIIPARICPYTTISPGIRSKKSKYFKYRISSLRGKEFSVEAEKEYNRQFCRKYKDLSKKN